MSSIPLHLDEFSSHARAAGSPLPVVERRSSQGRMAFGLFVLVTAVLIVRPADVLPALGGLPIYEMLIVACLAAGFPKVLAQFSPGSLLGRPITLMVVGIAGAIALSHLARGAVEDAVAGVSDFIKIILYYLLLVATVDTPKRLRRFLLSLTICVVGLTALCVLDFRGVIDMPAISTLQDGDLDGETGEAFLFPRLRAAGIFNDPNDLCQILIVGVVLCLYWAASGPWLHKLPWLGCAGLLVYGVHLTQSRGGLLGLLGGLGMLVMTQLGLRRSIFLGMVVLPVLGVLSGRQMEISTTSTTGQERIQLWSDALVAFERSPIFGIGQGKFAEEAGLVAHNSFIQAFTELGAFGGTLFLGAFFVALWSLHRLRRGRDQIGDGELARMRPFLTAAIAAYAVSMLSLSRGYDVPTYMMLALATTYLRAVGRCSPLPAPRVSGWLVAQVLCLGAAFVVISHVFVRYAVQWG